MTAAVVLDASAVLAWLQNEPGADEVEPHLQEGSVSAVNWSEILQKVAQCGRDPHEAGTLLRALGLVIVPLTQEDAEEAAALWPQVHAAASPLPTAAASPWRVASRQPLSPPTRCGQT